MSGALGKRVLRCISDLARAGGANDYRIDRDIPRRDPRTGWRVLSKEKIIRLILTRPSTALRGGFSDALKMEQQNAMLDRTHFCLTYERNSMAKASVNKPTLLRAKRRRVASKGNSVLINNFKGELATSGPVVSKVRFEAVMLAAEQSGLLSEKGSRIGGRVSPALVRQAKRQTGIETDTDLIEFALATVALEDNFAEAFKESRGKVDPALKLGF
jgi:hypothetical protein